MKKYNYIVYIGRSNVQYEFCCLTVGITRRSIEDRQVEKGFTALFTFKKLMTRADAQSIEGHAQGIADKYYPRAKVINSLAKRKGKRPNRTADWWYTKPSKGFIALMMQAITVGYNRRFNTALEQHPYYKGAVSGLKKSPKE